MIFLREIILILVPYVLVVGFFSSSGLVPNSFAKNPALASALLIGFSPGLSGPRFASSSSKCCSTCASRSPIDTRVWQMGHSYTQLLDVLLLIFGPSPFLLVFTCCPDLDCDEEDDWKEGFEVYDEAIEEAFELECDEEEGVDDDDEEEDASNSACKEIRLTNNSKMRRKKKGEEKRKKRRGEEQNVVPEVS